MAQTFPNPRHAANNGRSHAVNNDKLLQNDGLTAVSRSTSVSSRPTPPRLDQSTTSPGRQSMSPPPPKPEGNMNRLTLRTKAALFATALGIIPAIAVGGSVYYMANRALMAEHRQAGTVEAESLQADFTEFLGERIAYLQMVATLEMFANPTARVETPRAEKSAALNRVLVNQPIYQSLTVFDRNGTAIAQAGTATPNNGKNVAAVQQALQGNSPVILPATPANGSRSVDVAVPVNDAGSGSVVGVVFAQLVGTEVANTLAAELRDDSTAYLLGPDNQIWLTTSGAAGQEAAAISTLFPALPSLPASSPATATLLKNAQTNQRQLVARTAPAPVAGNANLTLQTLVARDKAQLLAARTPMLLALAAGVGVAAILVGAIATWMARRATQPLLAASTTIEDIERGNLNARLDDTQGSHELVQLSTNINHLVGQFQTSLQTQSQALERNNFLLTVTTTAREMSQRDLTRAFQPVLAGARRLLNVDRVVIYRFNPDWSGYILSEAVSPGWPVALNDTIEDACIPESLRTAYRNGRVVPTADVFNAGFHPDHLALMERLSIKANLVVPILNQGRLFGLLVAHHCAKKHTWQSEEISFLQQLATQVGITLDLREIQEAQKQAETLAETIRVESQRTQTLKNITAQVAQSLDPTSIFNTAVREIRQAMEADRVIVYTFDKSWMGKIIAESVVGGWPRALGAEIGDPCFANDYVEKYKRGRVQATADIYDAGLTECHLQQLEPFSVRANLVAPILAGGELLGLLVAHQCSEPRQWEDTEKDFFAQLAVQVGFAIDRANLLQESKVATAQAKLLAEVTSARDRQDRDLDDIIANALDRARTLLKVERVVVYRFNPDWSGYISSESVAVGWPVALNDEIEDACIPERLIEDYLRGRVVPTNDVFNVGFHPDHEKLMERLQIKANLVTPIVRQGKLFGLLIAHHCANPHIWQEAEITFLSQLASQLGAALDRVNFISQLEESRQTAETLAAEQTQLKEGLQQRALSLLMEVDPVSRGDLTVRARVTEDEIGTIADSYNATVENLRRLVLQVQATAEQMSSTTNSNDRFVQQLSAGAIQQSTEIETALQRLQEMSQSIRAVAASAEQAENVVQEAAQTAQESDDAMNRTVEGIVAIRETVAETAKKVKRLGESSQKISKVVNLIGSFAAQTNLLALNASIEAARAGEEGRGFAVVADEVRSLARQSAEATAEIEKLVNDIQTETNEVVTAMEAGTEQVVLGTRMVDDTRSSLTKITAANRQINDLVEAIAQATVSQSQASESVTHTMTDVATISDATSDKATQVSQFFNQLLTLAQAMQESVGQFKV